MRKSLWRVLSLVFLMAAVLAMAAGCDLFPGLSRDDPEATPTLTPVPTATPLIPPGPYPPLLVDYTPRPGQEVAVDADITLRFDQPMDRESVAQALHVTPEACAPEGCPQIEGDLVWEDDATVVFRPKTLAVATRYRVSVGAEARSQAGVAFSDLLSFAFSTLSPLQVTRVSPEDGAVDLRADAPILVSFNRAMVPVNCAGQIAKEGTACPSLLLAFTPSVLGNGTWINTSLYRFEPLQGWGAGQSYQVVLAAGVASVEGMALDDPFVWSFSTAAPLVQDVYPANEQKDVLLDAGIRVVFNTPMDQEVTGSVFSITDAEGAVVSGAITWADNGATLLFTPTARLRLDARYTARIGERARAVTSAPLQNPLTWSFETVPAPSVRSFTPADGAEDVPIYAGVRLAWAGAVDAETLRDNVRIEPLPEGANVFRHFDETSGVYHLSWPREPRTEYCVTVQPGVADIYGNVLDEALPASCFTTGDLPPYVGPAVELEAFTLDASQPSRLYFMVRNQSLVDFTLYELDEAGFAQGREATGTAIREWTERFDIPANVTSVELVYLRRLEGALPPGYYRLAWSDPRGSERQIDLAVIDRHVTLKLATEDALVWVTDLRAGTPVSRTAVRLVDREGFLIAAGTTDNDGLARIPISPRDDLWDRVIAVSGEPGVDGFGVAATHWVADAGPWAFDIFVDTAPAVPYQVYLHTDRQIYRPGQVVYARGVVWADEDAQYVPPPSGTAVQVAVMNPMWDEVYSTTVTLNELGSFDVAMTLAEDAPVGEYVLQASLPAETSIERAWSLPFSVAAYRKPEFEVVVKPELDGVLQGEPVRALVESTYFFGGPVSNAALTWRVRAQPFAQDAPVPVERAWSPWIPSQVIAEGEATTDAQGRFLLELPGVLQPLDGDGLVAGDNVSEAVVLDSQLWTVEATSLDESGFPVTGAGDVVVHAARFYLSAHTDQWLVRERGRAEVVLRAMDWDAEPVAGQEISVTLAQRSWYEVPPEEPYASATWAYTDTEVSSLSVTTDDAGEAVAAVTPPRSGFYVVIARAVDAEGYPVRTETSLWVSGEAAAQWQMPEGQITPVADARSYRVGDTAKVMVPTPFTGTYQLLVTIERGGILDVERRVLDEANPVLEIPILAKHVPNAYVSVLLIRGADAAGGVPDVRAGYVNLPVEPVSQTLSVTLTPDRPEYEPGDPMVLTVRAQDATGTPVDAEVGLAVVDKAVLALRSPNVPSILDTFYGVRPLRVVMGDSLLVLLDRLTQNLALLEQTADRIAAEATIGGMGGGAAEVGPTPSEARQDFPDTALWDAHVRTGATGETQVTLPLPGSLTTWVAEARAVTAEALVGEARAEFRVSKPLLVRPVTPRFFVFGDRPQVAGVVHNNTGEDLEVTARLTIEGSAVLEDPAERVVLVPAGGRQRVAWTLAVGDDPVTSTGSVTATDATVSAEGALSADVGLRFSVEGGGYQDASYPTVGDTAQGLPIYRYAVPDVVGTAGVLEEAGSRVDVLHIPEDAGPASAVELRVQPSLAAAMAESLSYLENYPYGSSDALVSRFLPNVLTYRTLQSLGVERPALAEKLEILVPDTLDRLYARQNADGGWGWWRDWSNMHLTSYAALGLIEAERSGFTVRQDALDRALTYIADKLVVALEGEERYPHYAFALYVLSEAEVPWPVGAGANLYAARESLGVTGRAYLAMALGKVDPSDTRVTTLLDDLRGMARVSATGAHWEPTDGLAWSTDTVATSVVLDALARFAPEDPLLSQAVRWLMVARRADRWQTTYETAWAIIALADVLESSEELAVDYTWGVALNGVTLGEGQAEAASEVWTWRAGLEGADPGVLFRDRTNVLEVARDAGPGRLYYATHLSLVLPPGQIDAESRGFSVYREYCAPSQGAGAELALCEPVSVLRPGDEVEVRLTLIVPEMRNYVLLRDPYPAGMEPVNPALETTPVIPVVLLAEGDKTQSATGSWWQNPFGRRELLDDHAAFFARSINPGTYRVTYRLRAAVPGTYHALPATASEMYFPEVWGRTDVAVVEVAP